MADLNSGAWGGRIISSPRLRTSDNGLKVIWFMLACHRFIKDASLETGWREHTDRFPVVAWGYLAERVSKAKLETGAYLNITGRLQTYDYQRKLETTDGEEFTIPATGFEIALDTFNVVSSTKASETTFATGGRGTIVSAQENNLFKEEFEENLPL